MSRAGQGDELGSAFRCAVTTHLAVHGLRRRSVLGLDLPDGVDPIRLEFETGDPTGDIRVTFCDGRRAYVSAQRTLSKGRPLHETVAGWVAQAPTLGADDLLVIAGAHFVGPLRYLDRALRRHRAGQRMQTRTERDPFRALADLLPQHTREVVLDRARVLHLPDRVLHLPDSTGAAAPGGFLGALMDFVVVDGQGDRAVSALADSFQAQAGEALASGIDDWVQVLDQAGLTVVADRSG